MSTWTRCCSRSCSCSDRLLWTIGMLLILLLGALLPLVNGSLADDFISLPAEFAAKVPARLVFTQDELIQCWREPSARRCVLRGPIVLDQASWQQAFADTGGSAVVSAQRAGPAERFTLTSELCMPSSTVCSSGGGSTVLQTINFNVIPYAVRVEGGATLVFTNVQLFNLAPASSYSYSSSTLWRSTGQGTTSWPSIGLAPNATAAFINASILYYNPSSTDDCAAYTQKRIFAFRQVWGEGNITVVNASTNRILGPQTINVTIRNGSDDRVLGNATVYYRNVSFICMENTTATSLPGPDTTKLAVAIAVPVGVVLLASGLLFLWYMRRRRRRHRQQPLLAVVQPKGHPHAAAPAAAGDSGGGRAGLLDAQPGRQQDQVKLSMEHTNDSSGKFSGPAVGAAVLQVEPSRGSEDSKDVATPATAGTRHNSQALQGSGGALPWNDSVAITTSMHGSGGTYDLATCSTGLRTSEAGLSSRGMDSKISSAAALLKQRSDVAVLRDLRIGPLLGRGSYGRVYRGRWKATPVAVKIIEHHASGARSSGGKTVSAGRETLLATSVSHPNVVTTYHISTMSMSERSALASSWLDGGGPSQQVVQEEPPDSRDDDGDSSSGSGSTVSSDLDEDPPDIMETWVVMEFCEKGSLERAVRLGKFRRGDDQQGQMVGIYKALLDTASGLDYLHSIGVVHGDLKTANVLLKGSTRDARGVTCKITDFGLSRVLDVEATHISTGTYGTIVYMPKELLLSGRMTQATDIYSFGLMMWELFACEPVMSEGLSIGQMFYMIAYEGWRPQLPPNCPPGYVELMTSCWHEDPEQRPTAQQLLRRLQKLYVQTKQQYLAGRGGASSSASRSTSRAGRNAPTDAAAAASAAEASPSASGGTVATTPTSPGALAAAAAAAAAAGVSAYGTSSNVREQLQQPVLQLPRAGSSQVPMLRHTSSRLTSSVEEGSSSIDFTAPAGRRSIDYTGPGKASRRSIDTDEPDVYQPYVQAVLQRSTSVSSPRFGRPLTPLTPTALHAEAAGALMQPAAVPGQEPQRLGQDQFAAQQQLLQGFAVFVPRVVPLEPSEGMVGTFGVQEYAAGHDLAEEDLFDEDGLASESLLRQLMGPSSTQGGVEFDDHFSGYLHPAPAETAAQTQSMQETVDQYRQQLAMLQQRSQQQQS